MGGKDTFSTYNPIINFVFYIGAFVFGMFFIHPAFLVCAVLLSTAYYLSIRGGRGIRLLIGMAPVFILMSIINPLLNTGGETVLFAWAGGRPYTLEALFYGMALGGMFVSVITWFASYSAVMTSDKFIYLFGRMIPSLSLILTMVLRLVPEYQKKTIQICGVRKCLGKGTDSGTKKERVAHGLTILSALTTWALEGGIITADSMRSRGYGSGRRTSFSIYAFGRRDVMLLGTMAGMMILIILSAVQGGTAVTYTPALEVTGMDNIWTVIGTAAYFIFLSIPTVLNIVEEITWRILRSKI